MSYSQSRSTAARQTVLELQSNGVRLGKVQASILKCLVEKRVWPGGWIWDTESRTKRVLDSLVKRGLVQHDPAGWRTGTYRASDELQTKFNAHLYRLQQAVPSGGGNT